MTTISPKLAACTLNRLFQYPRTWAEVDLTEAHAYNRAQPRARSTTPAATSLTTGLSRWSCCTAGSKPRPRPSRSNLPKTAGSAVAASKALQEQQTCGYFTMKTKSKKRPTTKMKDAELADVIQRSHSIYVKEAAARLRERAEDVAQLELALTKLKKVSILSYISSHLDRMQDDNRQAACKGLTQVWSQATEEAVRADYKLAYDALRQVIDRGTGAQEGRT